METELQRSEGTDSGAHLGEPRTAVGSHSACARGSILTKAGPGPMFLMVCMPVARATLPLLLRRSQSHCCCLSQETVWAHLPPEAWETLMLLRFMRSLLWDVGHSRNHPLCLYMGYYLRSVFIQLPSRQIFPKRFTACQALC